MICNVPQLLALTLAAVGSVTAFSQSLESRCQNAALAACSKAPNPSLAQGLEAWYNKCRCDSWRQGLGVQTCTRNCVADLTAGMLPESASQAQADCAGLCDSAHCSQPGPCNS